MAKKTTRKSTEKTPKTPKQPPKGFIGAGDDLLHDMENNPPDPDEIVYRIHLDGTMTSFPASELDPKDW